MHARNARAGERSLSREVNGRLERGLTLIVGLSFWMRRWPTIRRSEPPQLSRTTRELWKRVSEMVVQAETRKPLENTPKH